MNEIAGRDQQHAGEENRKRALERRFRDVGAMALIEEIGRLSDSLGNISKRLSDVETSAATILSLLDFPLPRQGPLQPPLMARVVANASMFCNSADGFHGLEHLPDGTAFRWTGPQREFRFMVFVDRQQACPAELILLNSKRLREGDQIACYVDRSWVPHEIVPAEERFVRLAFTLPKLEINRGTEILFVAPSVIIPKDVVPGHPDPRSLGVQFVELRVGGAEAGVEGGGGDGKQSLD